MSTLCRSIGLYSNIHAKQASLLISRTSRSGSVSRSISGTCSWSRSSTIALRHQVLIRQHHALALRFTHNNNNNDSNSSFQQVLSMPQQSIRYFTESVPRLAGSTPQFVFQTPMLNKMRPKLDSMMQLHQRLLMEINNDSNEQDNHTSSTKFAEKTKQLHDLSLITDRYKELQSLHLNLDSLQNMLTDPSLSGNNLSIEENELIDMTKEEIQTTIQDISTTEKSLLVAMLPKDTTDEANAILEIRAGTGGDEAGLFASEILRMYERFSDQHRWKWEEISKTYDGLGAIKDATVAITGHNVFGQLKFESGVHRVQRVPATETQGRIHTSTITVAIMPQPTEIQVQIAESDVRVDVFRASGAGGQKVNTTDSAIRLTHLATGIVVAIQDERSNQKNRAKAFTILRAKLFEREREKLANERRDSRRKQVGQGTRSEKIRTYNFPQNRVTDHRINKTLHELESVMNGEMLDEFVQALSVEEQTDKLMAMNEEAEEEEEQKDRKENEKSTGKGKKKKN